MYPVERLGGFSRDEQDIPGNQGEYPGGTILGEIFGDWRYPPVVAAVSDGLPLEYGRIWQAAQDRAARPVKMGVVSAQPVSNIPLLRAGVYSDRRELLWDLAGVMNAELRRLAEAGCPVIQVEEPSIHWRAADGNDPGYVSFLVDSPEPRGGGPGRRRGLGAHLLGQPRDAAVPREHRLRRLHRAVHGTRQRGRLDHREQRPRSLTAAAVRALQGGFPRQEGRRRHGQPPDGTSGRARRRSRATSATRCGTSPPRTSSCRVTAVSAGRALAARRLPQGGGARPGRRRGPR